MNTLSKEDTMEYFKHAIDLESSVIGQEQIIEKYKNIAEEQKPALNLQPLPERQYVEKVGFDFDFWFLTALDAMWVIIALTTLMVTSGSFAFFCFIVAAILIVRRLLKINKVVSDIHEASALQTQYDAVYAAECEKVKAANDRRQANYDIDLPKWETSNSNMLFKLNASLANSNELLEQYYSVDVIFPKYRNLPALTSIYEYLASGRCDELTGPNGAYNLYELELRQNTVISQLNTIISNLEQIQQNQQMLYRELVQITQNTRKIVGELSAIRNYTYAMAEFTALNAYYSGVTAANSSAMAFYHAIF